MVILQNPMNRFDRFQPRTRRVESPGPVRAGWLGGVLLVLISIDCAGPVAVQAETFIDRQQPTDLRVVSFNVWLNTIVPGEHPTQPGKFVRLVNALDPDILNLQEVYAAPASVVSLLNDIAPLDEGTWYAHQGRANVIASKYPLSMQATSIDSVAEHRPPAIALVDLPDDRFETDFYLINHHFFFGATAAARKQQQQNADATVRWIRDARMPGGRVDLPPGTPIAVVGDLNNFISSAPLGTIVTGDISDESTFGPDFLPDWDGSALAESRPSINGEDSENYTVRSGSRKWRVDHIIYSDSVLNVANKFVLNTVDMSPAELTETGLEEFDVTIDLVGSKFDHLPVVADFRLVDTPWYLNRDGAIDWIHDRAGNDHTYSGINLQPDANLAGAVLVGASLAAADLSYANLTGADLSGANLAGSHLVGANLCEVDLSGAGLSGADLAGTDLSGAIMAGIQSGGILGSPADFPDQFKLEKGYLVGPHANLSDAHLVGANLREVDLAGVTLASANLTSTDMSGANLAGADLAEANLSGAIFTDVESWATASWGNAFYGTNDVPTWASGMDQAWRDSVGILEMGLSSGDFNGDGAIDGADYTIWKDNVGLDSSVLGANGSGEATVVRKDYRIWEMNFQTSESVAGAGRIPEPTSLLLAFLALTGVPLRRLAFRCG